MPNKAQKAIAQKSTKPSPRRQKAPNRCPVSWGLAVPNLCRAYSVRRRNSGLAQNRASVPSVRVQNPPQASPRSSARQNLPKPSQPIKRAKARCRDLLGSNASPIRPLRNLPRPSHPLSPLLPLTPKTHLPATKKNSTKAPKAMSPKRSTRHIRQILPIPKRSTRRVLARPKANAINSTILKKILAIYSIARRHHRKTLPAPKPTLA